MDLKAGVLSGSSESDPISRLAQVAGEIKFLAVVGLWSLCAGWLPARG